VHSKHKAKRQNSSTGKKKRNAGGFTIPVFKLHFKTIEAKTAWWKPMEKEKDRGPMNKFMHLQAKDCRQQNQK
jgi:hypothetical protein